MRRRRGGRQTAKEAAHTELNLLSRAMGLESAEFLLAKPRAVAGDIAAPIRAGGPEFMGGMTALLYAAREGQMDAARALVEGGADINNVSGEKVSPLVMAITNGHLELAQVSAGPRRRSQPRRASPG